MSTKRKPLFTDEDLQRHGPHYVIGMLEASRAKDAELIQMLVDEIMKNANGYGQEWEDVLNAAAAAGFKPSEE